MKFKTRDNKDSSFKMFSEFLFIIINVVLATSIINGKVLDPIIVTMRSIYLTIYS